MIKIKNKNSGIVETPDNGYSTIFIDELDNNLKMKKADGSVIFINNHQQNIFSTTKNTVANSDIYEVNGIPDSLSGEFYIKIDDENIKNNISISINNNHYTLTKGDKSDFEPSELKDIIIPIIIDDNQAIITGESGIKIRSLEFQAFKQLISSNSLVPQKSYIVDFKTKYTIGGTVIESSITQKFIITATGSNTFYNQFNSVSYPKDIISINLNEEKINYRKCNDKLLSANYDWRYVKFEKGLDDNGRYTVSDIYDNRYINRSEIFTFDNSPSGGSCYNIQIENPKTNRPDYDNHGIDNGRNSLVNCQNIRIINSTNSSLIDVSPNSHFVISGSDITNIFGLSLGSVIESEKIDIISDNANTNCFIKSSKLVSVNNSDNTGITGSTNVNIVDGDKIGIENCDYIDVIESDRVNINNSNHISVYRSSSIVSTNDDYVNSINSTKGKSANCSDINMSLSTDYSYYGLSGKNLYPQSAEISRITGTEQLILMAGNPSSDIIRLNFTSPLENKPLLIAFDTNNSGTPNTPYEPVIITKKSIEGISTILLDTRQSQYVMVGINKSLVMYGGATTNDTSSQRIPWLSSNLVIENNDIDIRKISNIEIEFNGSVNIENIVSINPINNSKIRIVHTGVGTLSIINNVGNIKSNNTITLTEIGHFVRLIYINSLWYVENYFS